MRHQAGLTMIELVVALALAGVIVITSISLWKFFFIGNQKMDKQAELIELRNFIFRNFDAGACATTVAAIAARLPPPSACDPATADPYVSIETNQPVTPIIIKRPFEPPAGYTQFGLETSARLFVRARCVDCAECVWGKKILIEYLRGYQPKDPGVSIEPEPIANEPGDWRDLFRDIPMGCPIPL